MNVVKSAIGSLIGAAIGVAVYFGIQKYTGQTYIWFPLVIGILTGIVARILAGGGQSNAARYVAGALAGLIAGAAILGIDFVPTLMATKPEFGPIDLKDRVAAASEAKVDRMKSKGAMAGDDTLNDADAKADKTDADGDINADDATENEQVGNTSQDETGELDSDEADRADDMASDREQGDMLDDETGTPDNDMDMMKRDRSVAPETPNNADANSKRFAEIIKKQSHQTWYDFALPHVFTGLGMLIAYQVVRGFGASSPKK